MPKLTMSYVQGPSDAPLRFVTIGRCLDEAVAKWGDREALVARHQNVRMSYREFGRLVNDLAAGLAALGLARGERIGIWAPN